MFEIVPRSDASSFQVGYLGAEGLDAWLIGDVLTKLDLPMSEVVCFERCTVYWSAIESVQNKGDLVLYHDECVVWNRNHDSHTLIPSVIPFQFELTSDLPQCSHIPESRISYKIVARLHHRLGHDIFTCAPFHPRRYIKAGWSTLETYANIGKQKGVILNGDAEYSFDPIQWVCSDTMQAFFWLERNIIRHVDPIRVQVHIPPPSGSLVVEKGLQLQSVEATLNRIIQSHAWGRLYSDIELLHHLSEQDKLGSVPVTSKPHRDSQSSLPRLYQHLVVFTGKSCRFHSQRPIHICLSLHPGSILGSVSAEGDAFDMHSTSHGLGDNTICESITQDTVLQKVRFVLTIRIVIRNEMGEHKDIVTRKLVKVLPSPAGPLTVQMEKVAQSESHEKSYVQIRDNMIPQQDADVFDTPPEYDGSDDLVPESSSMRAITLTNPGMISQLELATLPIEYCETALEEPPPNIHEHVNDTHVPDYIHLTPTPSSHQHEVGMDATMDPCDEELPNFDEASFQPQSPLTMAVQEWNTREDYTAPPSLPEEGPPFTLATNLVSNRRHEDDSQSLPPSYTDSTNLSSTQRRDRSSSPVDVSELLPPAYVAQTPVTDRHQQDNVFPPLYEA